ncbi:prostaglandin E2 receptor EP4 subtype-like [Saccostrea echinata]|uniref:prostaglandin E2 receptor EP4 subtype-like n=1 Tax=Saccostrea echinata TaxID=191078 RepID=UPI002A8105A9|nr:prostaglandin E2 receptor EP4 subtype-like [Saccostrea echinata]
MTEILAIIDINQTTPKPGQEWPSMVPATLLLVFGITGNVLALIILCSSTKTHKWRPFYRFVCGLAITDGGGVLLSYPIIMVRYGSKFKFTYPERLCDYMAFIFMFTILASALIVCAMSFDRFIAILYPHCYNTPTKNRKAVLTIVGIWIFSAFMSSLHLMVGQKSQNFFPGSWCFMDFSDDATSSRILAVLYSLTGILILATTAVLNTIVIIRVCYDSHQKKKNITKKKNIHIIIFLFLIVILFSSCISSLLVNIFGHAVGTISGNGQFELNSVRLSILNSIIDPWIYILFRKDTFDFFKRRAVTLGFISVSTSTSGTPFTKKENLTSDLTGSHAESSQEMVNPA